MRLSVALLVQSDFIEDVSDKVVDMISTLGYVAFWLRDSNRQCFINRPCYWMLHSSLLVLSDCKDVLNNVTL